mmetsp:Transcript_76839/g.232920  ORF Transcript_76839/g.232920 Transcript_76839/m.232920 type:complete len:112 (+) Transcript_76839:8-343(+)
MHYNPRFNEDADAVTTDKERGGHKPSCTLSHLSLSCTAPRSKGYSCSGPSHRIPKINKYGPCRLRAHTHFVLALLSLSLPIGLLFLLLLPILLNLLIAAAVFVALSDESQR